MDFNIKEKDVKAYVKKRFKHYYPDVSDKKFNELWTKYKDLKPFAPDGNIWESGQNINDHIHLIIRLTTQFFISKSFEAQLIDLDNPNVAEDLETGNIGTPGRLAKVQISGNISDDSELGSGRWMKPIRLAKFPNVSKKRVPIIKEVSLVSACSHHFISFNSLSDPESKVIVAYIPDKFVLGISKLSRLVNFLSRRFYLQEDLTKKLYENISKAAETEDVYVGLFNIVHGCEKFRGKCDPNGKFSTEYYGGEFETNLELLKQVRGR